jgi:type II secretory pathway predicted ATPase ExeA
MVEAQWQKGDAAVATEPAAGGFYNAPFLEELLFDLTLAVDMGGPVFLLGPKGGGKSALVRQAARRLGGRYYVAWLEGRPKLTLDEVVETCRRSFDPEIWKTLALRPERAAQEARRPSDNLLIVESAEAMSPRFLEQLVAISNGYESVMPSHRILLAGSSELAPLIEVSQLRNNWGAPVVLQLPTWPDEEVVPFLRHRMACAGLHAADVLTDPVVARIAHDAAGNPRRMLELAQDTLQRAGLLDAVHLDMDLPEPPMLGPLAKGRPPASDLELVNGAITLAPQSPSAPARRAHRAIAGPVTSTWVRPSRARPLVVLAGVGALGALGVWGCGLWPTAGEPAPRTVAKAAAPVAPILAAIPSPSPRSTSSGEAAAAEPAAQDTAVAAPTAEPPPLPPEPIPSSPAPAAEPAASAPPTIASPTVAQTTVAQAQALVTAPAMPSAAPPPVVTTPLRTEPAPVATPETDAPASAAVTPPPAVAAPTAPAPVQTTLLEPPPSKAMAPTPAPAPVVAQPPRPPAPKTEPAQGSAPTQKQIEDLIERGNTLLRTGDFASARLFYVQAARAGSGKAATAVAWTYDPDVLDRMGVIGSHGDPAKALEWYRKAVSLGDEAAAEPLRRLSAQ